MSLITNPRPPRRVCLITGASAGIGESFARLYAAKGWDLALTARRGDRLRCLGDELHAKTGAAVQVVEADLADPAAPARIVGEVEAAGRPVSALVNNAGYGLSGAFAATAWEDQAAQLQVMIVALCQLARLTAPAMQAQGYGRILNVASVAGLLPGSRGDVLYAPTKSFVVKVSQALNLENRNTGVHVTALCPGYTYSEFHDVNGSREKLTRSMPSWMWLDTDKVTAAGYDAVEANQAVCVPGAQYKAITGLARLIPESLLLRLMSRDLGFVRG